MTRYRDGLLVALALLLAAFAGWADVHTDDTQFVVFFVLLGLNLILGGVAPRPHWRLAAAGLAFGMAILCKQHAVLFLAVPVVLLVAAAIWPIMMSGAELAIAGRLWCSAHQ